MPTTDEELDALRESVELKRTELADARRAREEDERATVNDITAAELKAEEARLDAQLSELAADTKAGAENSSLVAAEEAMRQAQAQQEAQDELNQARSEAAEAAENPPEEAPEATDSETKE